jgi:hypothetical protein
MVRQIRTPFSYTKKQKKLEKEYGWKKRKISSKKE